MNTSTSLSCWIVNSDGEVWTLNSQGVGSLMSPAGQDFAFDIAVSMNDDAWIISTEPRQGGAVIKVRPGGEDEWYSMAAPAAAIRISVAPNGMLWTVNAAGEVWVLYPQGGGYRASPSGVQFAYDISAGADGSVWVVSYETREGGNVLQSYNQSTKTWTPLPAPAAATNVSVSKSGDLYTVNSIGEVWLVHPQGGGAILSPPGVDFGQEINVGPDGTVWLISSESRAGGNVIKWWSDENQTWNSIPAPAAAVRVAGTV